MNPQDPLQQQPAIPPQPQQQPPALPVMPIGPSPVISNAPVMAPPQRSGRKKWIVIIAVVVVVLGAGAYVAMQLLGKSGNSAGGVTYSKQGDAAVGELKAGSFNYVNACDALTADDLDSVTGKTSNRMEIKARYAQATDPADPLRTYHSTCMRNTSIAGLSGDLVLLSMSEYSSKDVHDKFTKLKKTRPLDAYGPEDPALVSTFGAATHPVLLENTLYLTIDNKEISLQMSLVADKSKISEWAVSVGKLVQARVAEVSAKASAAPNYAGAGIKVGSFPYRQACGLWGMSDFKGLFSVEADAGELAADIAEKSQDVSSVRVSSGCTITQKPAKTELDTGNLAGVNDVEASVLITVDEYTTLNGVSIAGLPSNGTPVSGIGDKAVLNEYAGGVRVIKFQKANTITSVQISRSKGGSSVDTPSDVNLIKQISTTIAGRIL